MLPLDGESKSQPQDVASLEKSDEPGTSPPGKRATRPYLCAEHRCLDIFFCIHGVRSESPRFALQDFAMLWSFWGL